MRERQRNKRGCGGVTYSQLHGGAATDRSRHSSDEGEALGADHQYFRSTCCAEAQCSSSRQGGAGELVTDAGIRARRVRDHVNTIAPGRINTAQILRLHPTEQSRADYIKQNISCRLFRRALRHRPSRSGPGLPARPLHQRRCHPGRRGCGAAGAVDWPGTRMTIRPQDEYSPSWALPCSTRSKVFRASRGKNIARRRYELAPFGALKRPDPEPMTGLGQNSPSRRPRRMRQVYPRQLTNVGSSANGRRVPETKIAVI